jgi:hypothetical protein
MPVPKGQIKAIDSKIAAIQKAQRAELQLKLFPDWPDDRAFNGCRNARTDRE